MSIHFASRKRATVGPDGSTPSPGRLPFGLILFRGHGRCGRRVRSIRFPERVGG